MWEDQLEQNPAILQVRAFLNRHPHLLLVTGIDGYRSYGNYNPGRFSIRESDGMYYEAYNSAVALAANMPAIVYHKSKLVPGVEALPRWLGFMGSLFNDFGGISGSLGRSDSAIVFGLPGNPYAPAPIICYESIFSDYTTEYVRRGANILTIITNDGWWGNTPGHQQHMAYARLRAIETGLWVARSANTGISCFISPQGKVVQPQPWDTAAALKLSISPANTSSFYTRTGDWLSRTSWPLACILILATIALRFTKRRNLPAI
jgi:apolipoprotein N-acyltransferase